MKHINRVITALMLAFTMTSLLAITYVPAFAAGTNVWWPTNGAHVSNVQPFKAVIDGMPLSSYSMYWQVDNGQLNPMSDNMTDAPHKEASVDVSSWHWQTNGSYNVNFVAKDQQGNTIGNQAVTIYANENSAPTVAVVPNVSTVQVAQAASPAPSSYTEDIWWPTNGVTVNGTQPFKGMVENMPLSNYSMYWQVDGGQLNLMNDNSTDGPHKEADVNVSGWNWKGSGPYAVTMVAKDTSGKTIGSKTVNINVAGTQKNTAVLVVATPPPTAPTTPPAVVTPPVTAPIVIGTPVAGNPISGLKLFVDPNSPAAQQASSWRTSRPADAALMDKIAIEPAGKWFGGWNSDIQGDAATYVNAAAAQGSVPVLIAYNIPFRDCGGFSAGGATTASAYQSWITGLANGIGSRKAVVILEPDALAGIDCLSASDQSARYTMLQNAVSTLKSHSGTSVYIDAGNSNWVSATDMAPRLKNAGVALADGFALNVSNFYANADLINFGQSLSPLVNGKHFVIDTSRNGLGPDGSEWCNPSGRALGMKPTTQTGNPLIDAFLWLKTPGESDGACNGGPSAGVWWPEYALGLSQRAAY